eukprot:353725_1
MSHILNENVRSNIDIYSQLILIPIMYLSLYSFVALQLHMAFSHSTAMISKTIRILHQTIFVVALLCCIATVFAFYMRHLLANILLVFVLLVIFLGLLHIILVVEQRKRGLELEFKEMTKTQTDMLHVMTKLTVL